MGLFFKKSKKEESFKGPSFAKVSAGKEEKSAKKAEKKKEAGFATPEPIKAKAGKKGDVKMAPGVLSKPQITEKATFLMEKNQYIFQVFKVATKPEVKKAVQEVYGVDVEKVRIINVDRKKKRLGRTTGWKKGYKKAIVTIKKGQEIELIPR